MHEYHRGGKRKTFERRKLKANISGNWWLVTSSYSSPASVDCLYCPQLVQYTHNTHTLPSRNTHGWLVQMHETHTYTHIIHISTHTDTRDLPYQPQLVQVQSGHDMVVLRSPAWSLLVLLALFVFVCDCVWGWAGRWRRQNIFTKYSSRKKVQLFFLLKCKDLTLTPSLLVLEMVALTLVVGDPVSLTEISIGSLLATIHARPAPSPCTYLIILNMLFTFYEVLKKKETIGRSSYSL